MQCKGTCFLARSTENPSTNNKFVNVFQIQEALKRSSDDQSSRCASVSSIRPSTSRPVSRRQSVPLPGTKTNLKVVHPKMSDHPPHSMAYQKRNRTTHMWTDGSQLMSQSLPSSSFLHRQFASSASSSPRSSRDATSEKASPAGKSATARPSSSYSYDGGFFVGAHSGQAEYFVIHPDWVSEAVTIKKLSIGSKSSGPPVSKSASFRNWGGRRCLSAPPAKRRNPITWDQSEPVDIPERRY
ncbi:uncharacterized protein LOC131952666 [Physella acuta]|uniref:uncharacterized protein LOC131952666 n=1 Tax=Physella acuta TaxID=109671 RepID=UPI0027DDFFC8|nr:uncharacterized protein LOC131952666 [Physella acuta]